MLFYNTENKNRLMLKRKKSLSKKYCIYHDVTSLYQKNAKISFVVIKNPYIINVYS